MSLSKNELALPQHSINELIMLFNEGKFKATILRGEHLTQTFPKSIIIFEVLAAAYMSSENLEKSIEIYQKILQLDPEHVDAHNNLGMAFYDKGEFNEALDHYQKAVHIDPDFSDAHYNLGNTHKQLCNLQKAIESYGECLKITPDDAEVLFNYGTALKDFGEFDRALDCYKKILALGHFTNEAKTTTKEINETQKAIESKINGLIIKNDEIPEDAQLNYYWALIFHDKKNTKKSLQRFELAIKIAPAYADAHSHMGLVFFEDNQIEAAIQSYKIAIQIRPDYAETYYYLGLAQQAQSDLTEALASYKKAVQIKPDHAKVYFKMGLIQQVLQDLKGAKDTFKKAVQVNPNHAEAYYHLGLLQKDLNRRADAQQKAIQIKPDYAEAHLDLGLTQLTIGNLDQAVESFENAIQFKPNQPAAYYYLGNVMREKLDYGGATEYYKKAIAIKQDYTQALKQLGITMQEAQQFEESIQFFDYAIKSCQYDPVETGDLLGRMLKALWELGDKSRFLEEFNKPLICEQNNAMIGSYACRAAHRYGVEINNLYCMKPLNYVLEKSLLNVCNFKEIFINAAHMALADRNVSEKKQTLLLNGYQTAGNLFSTENHFSREVQDVIRMEVEIYRELFKNSAEGLIKNWPADYSINGWIVSMKSGGAIRPHIHETGWISGSVYINIPKDCTGDSGNLVVSIDDDPNSVGQQKKQKEIIIDVQTGSLCLFPSSLLHHTIPFVSDEERIVLAFDILPK